MRFLFKLRPVLRLLNIENEKILGIVLVLPTLTFLIVVSILPITWAFWISLHQKGAFATSMNFVSFQNYINLIHSSRFYNALLNSLYFGGGTVILQLVVGLIMALVLVRSFKGRPVIRGLIILPYFIPTVVEMLTFKWMFSPAYGVVNVYLQNFGLFSQPIDFFGSYSLAMPSVILAAVWKWSAFVTIVLLARLEVIPQYLYEAAEVDGASPFQKFLHITLPQLKGAIMLCILLRGLWMFNKFDIIWLFTKGGPFYKTETLPVLAYRTTFQQWNQGQGVAVAIIMLAILVIAASYYVLKLYKPEEEVAAE